MTVIFFESQWIFQKLSTLNPKSMKNCQISASQIFQDLIGIEIVVRLLLPVTAATKQQKQQGIFSDDGLIYLLLCENYNKAMWNPKFTYANDSMVNLWTFVIRIFYPSFNVRLLNLWYLFPVSSFLTYRQIFIRIALQKWISLGNKIFFWANVQVVVGKCD